MHPSKLKNAQTIATIFAAIAVPIVVAFAGWQIQRTISADSIKKDYVQMAVTILSQPNTDQNQQLRAWAVKVLNKNAPVPMSAEVVADMSQFVVVPASQWVSLLKGSPLLDPPLEPVEVKDRTVGALLENHMENMYRCKINSAAQAGLQELIKGWIEADSKSTRQQDGT